MDCTKYESMYSAPSLDYFPHWSRDQLSCWLEGVLIQGGAAPHEVHYALDALATDGQSANALRTLTDEDLRTKIGDHLGHIIYAEMCSLFKAQESHDDDSGYSGSPLRSMTPASPSESHRSSFSCDSTNSSETDVNHWICDEDLVYQELEPSCSRRSSDAEQEVPCLPTPIVSPVPYGDMSSVCDGIAELDFNANYCEAFPRPLEQVTDGANDTSPSPPVKRKPNKGGRPRKSPEEKQARQATRRRAHLEGQSPGRLWQFIVRLLEDERSNPCLVKWVDEERGAFAFTGGQKVAEMWGAAKGNILMNYEKMTRCMRHYSNGAFAHHEKRLHYMFGEKAKWRDLIKEIRLARLK